MCWRIWMAVALVLSGRTFGLSGAEVTPVVLSDGVAAISLDFSEQDYELVLYPTASGVGITNASFGFKVSGTATETAPASQSVPADVGTDRERLESVLREEERALAARAIGSVDSASLSPRVRRMVTAPQVRSFAFKAFGDLLEDQTVEAVLVASNQRAVAYLDTALGDSANLSSESIASMLDVFSSTTYPLVTGVFGQPSDVDGDGRVLFLFTPWVDRVGGVRGFYRAQSLSPVAGGGDGNVADMVYISPTQSAEVYPALLAHEFQHLINYNQHVLLRRAATEESWLNEAFSHVVEDLVGEHVQGGNRSLVETYLSAPHEYGLTADAVFNRGVRGAAYLFLKGVLDDSADGALSRLAQTGLTGRRNVEAVTGQGFADLYRRFALRLFLSGTGLSADLDYHDTHLTEPVTGQRTLPPPRESVLTASGPAVEGRIQVAGLAFVRLTGAGVGGEIRIETEVAGAYRALLIPIPKGFQHQLAVATDFFRGITFDVPLQAWHASGESRRISGSVADPTISRLWFQFRPSGSISGGDVTTFSFDVSGGRFGRSIVFSPSDAGEYELTIATSRDWNGEGEILDRFSPVTVAVGSGPVRIPVDYFSGVTLDAPLPAVFDAGEGVRVAGAVLDEQIAQLVLRFVPVGGVGASLDFSFDVSGGRFGRSIVVPPVQAGGYELKLLRSRAGQSPVVVDRFSPVTIAPGSGTVLIPVDFFPGLILDAPLPGVLPMGQGVRFSGTVGDASVTQVLLRFRSLGATDEIVDFSFDVTDRRFARTIVLDPAESGDFELLLFKGRKGESLPFVERFAPVRVEGGDSVTIPVDFFSGMILDTPLPSILTAGQALRVSGTVPNPAVSQILLSLRPLNGKDPAVEIYMDVTAGRFGRSLLLESTQLGEYSLNVFMGTKGQALAFVGLFSPITVVSGDGSGPIPVDFFPGVILDAPLDRVLSSGSVLRLSGVVPDPAVSQVLVSIWPVGAPETTMNTFFDVANGRFGGSIFLDPGLRGDYGVNWFLGVAGEVLPFAGGFSPITIVEGSGVIEIPVDFFPGVTFDAPLPGGHAVGTSVHFSGRVTDAAVNQILFSFEPGGSDAGLMQPVRFFASVTEGRFDQVITFDAAQVGRYELMIFMGRAGEALPFAGRFPLVSVSAPVPLVAPRIMRLTFVEGAAVELLITGQPQGRVGIERSEDLQGWSGFLETVLAGDGEARVRDERDPGIQQRYYRVRAIGAP